MKLIEKIKKEILENLLPFFYIIVMIIIAILNFDKEITKFSIFGGFFVILLKFLFTKETDKFKAGLEKEVIRHKVQFERLHAERAEIIKEIYNDFYDLIEFLREYSGKIDGANKKFNETPSNKDYNEGYKKAADLRKKIKRNDIFFNNDAFVKEMISKAFDLETGFDGAHLAYQYASEKEEIDIKMENKINLINLINGNILKPLKKEFQKILGDNLFEK